MSTIYGRISDDPTCAYTPSSIPAELVGLTVRDPKGRPFTAGYTELSADGRILKLVSVYGVTWLVPFATRFELVTP